MKLEKIVFEAEDGTKLELYVEEETRIGGVSYLLVTDSDSDEANAYILKDLSVDGDLMGNYVMVEDDVEFDAVSRVFEQMLEDTDLLTE
ncbi:MAG: DUF1292 domain-containing protein [Eubacteriales bacterium]|nr:DUF1292 domain-containing protein [Eubacteriales bacterium]